MMDIKVGNRYDRPAPAFCTKVLGKFGQNHRRENIYRVVWSDSQYVWRGGLWRDHFDDSTSRDIRMKDGTLLETNPVVGAKAEYRMWPKYPDHKGFWVLEKWKPAPCDRDEWYQRYMDRDSGLCLLGPYPDGGSYHFCYVIANRGQYREINAGLIEEYARLIEAAGQYTLAEIRAAEEEERLKKEKAWEDRFDAIWDESQPAGGVRRLFSAVSGPKSADRVKPEDLDMPYVPRVFRQLG